MQKIIITTPDNIEIEYRLAQAGSRLAACVVDMAVQSVLFLVIALIFILSFIGNNVFDIISYNFTGWGTALIIISFFMVYFGYFIILEMITHGQSIGKKIFRLRVIRDNGQPIGFVQSLIRNLIRSILDILGIGLIMIFFSKKCKRLGDMIASTIVISENPNRIISESLTLSNLLPTDEHDLTISEYELNADEYDLLKDYLNRRDSFLESSDVIRGKLVKYFANKFDAPESIFTDEKLNSMLENKRRQFYG